jgi:hypothetical protein
MIYSKAGITFAEPLFSGFYRISGIHAGPPGTL